MRITPYSSERCFGLKRMSGTIPPIPTDGFPEYGSMGDPADARRMRRSFRFCVAACVFFSGMLWFSEKYLRYDLTESQYIMALTHFPESARTILREAVKRDAETREFPTPKYTAALAAREEADLILPTYEKAYDLDPNNSFLAIRYGCRLFGAGRYQEAADCFHKAASLPPKNTLPRYLEAATLPGMNPANAAGFIPPPAEDLTESLALLAKTNSSKDPIVFPDPLWSASLPENGMWYEKLRREIAIECCAPLQQYTDLVIKRAQAQIEMKEFQYWDSWLEMLQVLGERLTLSEKPGSLQAIAGIRIQLAALEQREIISKAETGIPDAALVERQVRLRTALDILNQFERNRDAAIAVDKEAYQLPLTLCWKSMALIVVFYALAYVISKITRARRKAWTLPHSRLARVLLAVGFVTLLMLFGGTALLQYAGEDLQTLTSPAVENMSAPDENLYTFLLYGVSTAWWIVLGVMLGFGLLYPFLTLPSVRTVLRNHHVEATQETVAATKKFRRVAVSSYLRRYYGLLAGLFLCLLAVWTIAYRVFFSLYPWQIELLTTGLAKEEAHVIRQIMTLIAN